VKKQKITFSKWVNGRLFRRTYIIADSEEIEKIKIRETGKGFKMTSRNYLEKEKKYF